MLNPRMTLAQLLDESARLHRPESSAIVERRRVLQAVGLADRAMAFPHELSGGERRRAGIARLMLARPRLVVADEPTAGLDAARKADLIELLVRGLDPSCAVVLISHDLPLITWAAHRVVVILEGEVVDRFPAGAWADPQRHEHTRALARASGTPC